MPAHEWIGQFQVHFGLCCKKGLCAKLYVFHLFIHSHENQVIFMWNVLNEHSIWKRGKQQLEVEVKSAYEPSGPSGRRLAWSD